MNVPCVVLQTLLTLPVPGAPVRVGVPLPAAAIAQGLRLAGSGALQWRRLLIGGPSPDPVWVELAIAGRSGNAAIVAGGNPPDDDGRGAVFVRDTETTSTAPHGEVRCTTWRYCDGTIDERRRTVFAVATTIGTETFAPSEACTVDSVGLRGRAPVWLLPHRFFESAGLLPPAGSFGKEVRKQLAAQLPRLRELPGVRGAGDFGRSGGIVTNLEFDTTLGLVRCAAAFRDADVFAMAARCARHLVDRDLDARSGLPFPHGPEHRTGTPEPGHAWLQGLLWVGLLTADDDLIAAAQSIGRSLASHPPRGEERRERARDHGWPLLEMEALLAVDPVPAVAAAADRLAVGISARHDPVAHTFRFGEGEVEPGVYLERAWVTAGIVVPALRAHLARRADRVLAGRVDDVQRSLGKRLDSARSGLPTHWRTAGGNVFAEHREAASPAALLLFDGLTPRDLRRVMQRDVVRDATTDVLVADDPDLATSLSIVARCRWVWQ